MVVKIHKRLYNNEYITDYMLTIYNGSRSFILYVPDLPTVKTFLYTFSLRDIRLADSFDSTEKDALRAYLSRG